MQYVYDIIFFLFCFFNNVNNNNVNDRNNDNLDRCFLPRKKIVLFFKKRLEI
jgi:hypothetical protein